MKGSMINKARPFEKLSPFGEVFRVLGLTAMLLLGSMVFAQAGVKGQAKKLAPDLRKLNPGATVDVIIQFANTPTEKHFNEVKGKGGLEKVRLEAIKGGAFTVPAAKLGELAVDPDVAYISPTAR